MENQSAFADTMNAEITAWLNDIEPEASPEHPVFEDSEDEEDRQRQIENRIVDMQPVENNAQEFWMGLSKSMLQTYGYVISSRGRQQVTISEVQDHLNMPPYPATDKNGILHFIHTKSNLEGIDESGIQAIFREQMSNVQFSHARNEKQNIVPIKFLAKNYLSKPSKAHHQSHRCSGIRYCVYTHPDILRSCKAHDHVKLQDINKLRQESSRPHVTQTQEHILELTENFYNGILQNWNRYDTKCQHPKLKQRICKDQTLTSFIRNTKQMVGCPLNSDLEPWHTATSVPPNLARIDSYYLNYLVKNGVQREEKKQCTYVGHATSRRTVCGFDHPFGPGTVKVQKCEVKFDIYLPQNQHRYPYLMLVVRGTHTHHPPYPTKMPSEIADEVIKAIKEHEVLDLTARRFILSPRFSRLNQKWGDSSLRAIHSSLNIEDKVGALIRREKLLQYPLGSSLAGVRREFEFDQLKDMDDQWIREIYFFDEEHYMIICCTSDQAKAFADLAYAEMDLSFKMVQGSTNLFSISGWDEEWKHILTYVYVFLNLETRKAYATMFERLFKVLQNVSRRLIHIKHIDQSEYGLCTITVDMCKKQAPGFGDFLHTRCPSKEWDEHLQHMLIFCQVHVKRAFQKKFPIHPAKNLIPELWSAENKDQVLERMQTICTAYPELKPWVRSKQVPWILAGLSKEQSKIPTTDWIIARKHSGLSESSHFKDNNHTGRNLSLLGAVLRLKHQAYELFDQRKTFYEQGIDKTWRNNSEVTRIAAQARRKDSRNQRAAERRTRHWEQPWDPENPYDSQILPISSIGTPVPSDYLPTPSRASSPTLPRGSQTSDISTAYTQRMHPPSTVGKRRRGNRKSAEDVDIATSKARFQALNEQIIRAEQRKLELEQEKRLKELEEGNRELERSIYNA